MFEKVNPAHPDKIADRIAGALVDLAYSQATDPRVAVEVLVGHGTCRVIAESSVNLNTSEAEEAILRIAGRDTFALIDSYPQDSHLESNQRGEIRCGDNGIFRGMPTTDEQALLSGIARGIYKECPFDGKYIINNSNLIICQSHAKAEDLRRRYPNASAINPLGDWTGGTDVDTGATNRKLGSDMGDAVTGGGLHGKDLSKADVSINIYAHIRALELKRPVEIYCAIGDEIVDGRPYREIVEIARRFIASKGGFEKFAEWGFI